MTALSMSSMRKHHRHPLTVSSLAVPIAKRAIMPPKKAKKVLMACAAERYLAGTISDGTANSKPEIPPPIPLRV